MRFIYVENIHVGAFLVIKWSYMSFKIRKIPNLVDPHSLYKLLHSQVYSNGLKPWISNVKISVDKWGWII